MVTSFYMSMTSRIDMRPAFDRHGAAFLSFPRAGTGMLDRIITHT